MPLFSVSVNRGASRGGASVIRSHSGSARLFRSALVHWTPGWQPVSAPINLEQNYIIFVK
jgi:hypothetical protein